MENSISSDLIRGHIDTIILYSLIDCDKHAQQISDSIFEKSNNKYEMNQATLYSSLKRLEKLGYIKPYWNDSNDGRRRFFKLQEKGKNFIDENLNNWNFSRAIIDKLLDINQQQFTSPTTDRIIDNLSVNDTVFQVNSTNTVKNIEVEKSQTTNNESDAVSSHNIQSAEMCENDKETLDNFQITPEKEINFRNILNGLVKTTKIVDEEPIVENEKFEKITEKEKLIDVIEQKNNGEKIISKCNIDFGDLEISASKNGYKISFSNSKQSRTKGKILVNSLNLASSVITSLIAFIELLIISNFIDFNNTLKIVSSIVCVLPVLSLLVVLLIKPFKTKSFLKVNTIITFLVIFFDFTLLTFVIEWLLGVDFTVNYDLICYFILPVIVYFDLFIFVYIRYYLSKLKIFISKK